MEVFHKCYGNVLWAKKLAPLYLLTEVLPMEDEYYVGTELVGIYWSF
jgi:hypothetical protein